MKVIILAAGQGTRLRPLTDDRPKCMVEINGKSIIARQIETIKSCGIREDDICIVIGYKGEVLEEYFNESKIQFVRNSEYETTNMVYSLMCVRSLLESENDVIISYGDIVYEKEVFQKNMKSNNEISVVIDDDWYKYWSSRVENPLDDAETLMYDENDFLIEIGQKPQDLSRIQSQYIGLMHYKGKGIKALLNLAEEAERRSNNGQSLWKTQRDYRKMYMTDLLQALIDEKYLLKAVHINRGWYEVDNYDDLKVAEKELKK